MQGRQAAIEAISKSLREFSDIEAYLYGSSARGDYNENSDIDLLILIPDQLSELQNLSKRKEIIKQLWKIEMESGFDISPLILQHKIWNQRKTPFTVNVLNDRIPL